MVFNMLLQVEEICDRCSLQSKSICSNKDDARSLSVLNKSQAAAVISSVSAVQCSSHKSSPIQLVWGLPGTGKTKTLSVLLCILLKRSYRVLTCAPTSIALTEVVSRVLRLVKEPYSMYQRQEKSFCALGDLLLIGSRTEFGMCDDLKEIWLDYRVDKLAECFAPQTGWKQCLECMMVFLEHGLSDYHLFLKENATDGAEAKAENETAAEVPISFLKFARNQYKATALPLKRCINVLCTHLSKKFMQHNLEKMVHLLGLLESFGNFLSRNDVISAELERHFAHSDICSQDSSGCEDLGCSTSATLCMMRSEVINLLRHLSHNLNLPNVLRRDMVRNFCFQIASFFFCTASGSYSLHEVDIEPLNLLVIDEATQVKECELAIPLQLEGIQHAVVFGDEWQLPAMLHSKVSEKAGLGRSLYERLRSLGHSKHLLDMQYRMHPKISSFPNAKFYQNLILDAPSVICKGYERHYLPGTMFGPYSFISICEGREEVDSVGESRKNMVEVAVIVKIVQDLFKAWAGSRQKLTIGIISPYAAQVAAIQEKIRRKYEKLKIFALRVMLVEGFQGSEEDIIIISTVRSDSGGSIGSLSNPKHCNVALTRARHCLWIMGNDKTLFNSGSCWDMLVRDAKDRNCFFNANEDKELAKVLLEAKKELGQLDDLLNGDSVLFKSARWKVLFSDKFRRSFGKLKSAQTQKCVINLLLRLSSGWRPKNIKVDSLCGSSLQLVKQIKVGDLYVISTIDIAKYSSYTQVLKIWDILPVEEIPKLLACLDGIFRMYTSEFIDNCKLKRFEQDLELPVTWEVSDDIVRFKDSSCSESTSTSSSGMSDERSCVETSEVKDSLFLMKFYSLSCGMVSHFLSGSDGKELDPPFELTDRESEVILYPGSTFILGRSGTGKTTILTMKLFRREQQHYFSLEGFPDAENCAYTSSPTKNWMGEKGSVLRQIFLTVSPMLCSAVKNQISNWKSFIHSGKNSSIPSLVDMYDTDHSIESRDTPDNFINIPPESYPLVITFRKFLMMLDGSMENSYFNRFNEIRQLSQGQKGVSKTFALNAFISTKEVNYERFSSSYWSHFNARFTKKLDSLTVFIEIISHIKGGIVSGRVLDFQLSREDYVLLSEGRVSTISKEEREMVYDIFLDYEKKKVMNGEFDLADLVIDLHRRLRNGSYHGEDMDFIYIDEVQDLTMRQLSLLKYLCKNSMEGFAFSECGSNGKGKLKEKGQISDVLHLNQNLRTHSGVLKLSQSVIDLLYHFFPLSVDILSPETSFIHGEAPVLLESAGDENAIVTIFGNKVNEDRSMTGFGAEQVILVRDESGKKEIIQYIGKQALVLTILECKGLEFQDVLLYNYFGTSPLKNQWRLVYEYMMKHELLMSNESFPSFSQTKHKMLCSELKQLYVAVTRTRQRLWICENEGEFSKPIFDYWKKLCLVQVRQVDESLARAMQVASSEADWSSRGIKLFNEGNFEMAAMCFERAQDLYRAKWAKAAGLRASADRMGGSDSELARSSLLEAAEIYDTIGKAELAARCYIDLKEFKKAGMLFLEKCGDSMLEDAVDCFSLAGCWSIAAEVCAKANYYTKCLSMCTSGNLFKTGLQYIKIWREREDADADLVKHQELKETEQLFLERAAIHYHKLKDTNKMVKFVQAFNSMELRRTFLRSRGYLDELMLLEVHSGNYVEASSIARHKGDSDLLHFFKSSFPEDSKMMLESMLSFRKTELWKNLIRESMVEDVMGSTAKLKHGQFWRVVMLVLMSGDLNDELYQDIEKRSVHIPKWELFLKELKQYMGSGLFTFSFAKKFSEALQYTFCANWRKQSAYVSPDCFIYLLEYLQFLLSCRKGTCVFITKSFLLETLSIENWNWNSNTIETAGFSELVASFSSFVSDVVHQNVLSGEGAVDWIVKTDFSAEDFSEMVLRVFKLVTLMAKNYDVFLTLVHKLMVNKGVISLLPQKLCEILFSGIGGKKPVIGKALKAIGDPLVILFSGNHRPEPCPDSIFIEMDGIHCKEDIIRLVSLDNPNADKKESLDISETTRPSDVNCASCDTDQENEACDIQRSYMHFWGTFDISKFKTEEVEGEPVISAASKLRMKAAVEECICVLGVAITKLNKNGSTGDCGPSNEAEKMVEELNQLSAALSVSDSELLHNISTIESLFKKLSMREGTLRAQLDSLFLDANVSPEVQNNNSKRKENPKSNKRKKKGKGKRR
ncbi:hypothetical protein MKX03_017662 [Papaver bracteatum]|nr:hypothetical protein MKX03_017662 [Papaver bracteatum]